MRKLVLVMILASLVFSGNVSGQTNYTFELTDGYFQSSAGMKPVHLTHEPPYPTQWVELGDYVRIWYAITLRQGEKNPCGIRSTPCLTKISFVSLADPKYSFSVDDDFRIEDQISIFYGIPIDREKTPLGAGKFIWAVEKDGKTLFSHEIYVEVR